MERKEKVSQNALHALLLVPLGALLGVIFLVLIYLLPTDRVKDHVYGDVSYFLREEAEIPASGFANYLWNHRELFTDAIMVQNATERIEGKNAFEHAMWVYHLDLREDVPWAPEDTLQYLAEGGDESVLHLLQYSRYWHGYLVWLKPLLEVFSWRTVLWIAGILQVLLMVGVVLTALRKQHPGVAVAVAAGWLYMKPALILASIDIASAWVITCIALLVMLSMDEKLKEKQWYPEFFILTGMALAYFDFLTYPMAAFGFPLCAYFMMHGQELGSAFDRVKKAAYFAFCFCVGYVGLWGMKWVLADLFLRTGTIKSAVSSIVGWTEAINGNPRGMGFRRILMLNLTEYDSVWYPIGLGALLLALVTLVMLCFLRGKKNRATGVLVQYLVVFAVPFAWFFVVQHHSGLHTAFTFRNFGIAVLAVAAAVLELCRILRAEGGKKENLKKEKNESKQQ